MKRFLIVIPAALMLAGCGTGGTTEANENENGAGQIAGSRGEVISQVAYIRIDSLISKYDLFVDKSSELQAKAAKAENELTTKGRSLERAVADAQNKVDKGLVTRSQAAELQQQLQQQEQNFYQHRDKVQQELAEDEQVMMNNIYNNLNEFLAEFNADYRYGMIIATSGGAPVIHANPELDITAEVLKALNDKYAKEKGKK